MPSSASSPSSPAPPYPASPTWRVVAMLVVVSALVTAPVAAFATHRFADVRDDSTHAASIAWLADAAVTSGCTADDFCAKDGVTREQMATFLYRLSGNDPAVPPVVNAATVQGVALSDVGGAIADASCPTNQVVSGFAGGTIVCSRVGSLTSADGKVTVTATDTGVRIERADGSRIVFDGAGLLIETGGDVAVKSSGDIELDGLGLTLTGAGSARLEGGAGVTVASSGSTKVDGSLVSINGGCFPVARATDPVAGGTILMGSLTVLSC